MFCGHISGVTGYFAGDCLRWRRVLVLLVCMGVSCFGGGVARAEVPGLISGGSFPATLPAGAPSRSDENRLIVR